MADNGTYRDSMGQTFCRNGATQGGVIGGIGGTLLG